MGQVSHKVYKGGMLLKLPKLTYTFHDPNPPEVLWKELVNVAAKLAVNTVENKIKEMEVQRWIKLPTADK